MLQIGQESKTEWERESAKLLHLLKRTRALVEELLLQSIPLIVEGTKPSSPFSVVDSRVSIKMQVKHVRVHKLLYVYLYVIERERERMRG